MTKKSNKTGKNTPDMGRNIVPVLGIEIDSSQEGELLKRACSWVPSGTNSKYKKKYFVTTPNPEIVTRATYDRQLANCLNSSDMATPDAIGIVAAMKYLSLSKPQNRLLRIPVGLIQGLAVGVSIVLDHKWLTTESEVVAGRILMEELIAHAARGNNPKIFLLGGKSGSATISAKILSQRYNIKEIKSDAGPWLDMDGKPSTPEDALLENEVIEKINNYAPQLLFVAFGPPKQEKWIRRNLPHLNAAVIMTVGGALDYVAGVVPEPPQAVSNAGFEWLWRLITQPARVGRIFTAVVVFPLKVFISSLKD